MKQWQRDLILIACCIALYGLYFGAIFFKIRWG